MATGYSLRMNQAFAPQIVLFSLHLFRPPKDQGLCPAVSSIALTPISLFNSLGRSVFGTNVHLRLTAHQAQSIRA